MKKLFQILVCAVLVVAASCSHGAKAINEAFNEACKAEPVEKVATTLCNGEIDCATLTTDEAAKLGAVLGYITYTGMYSANFEDQVDMYQFGKLLDGYREIEKDTDKQLIEQYTKEIFVTATPPPAPAPEPEPTPAPDSTQAEPAAPAE